MCRKSPTAFRCLIVLALGAPSLATAQDAGLQAPQAAVFITYDNSLSMDFTTTLGYTPSIPATCEVDINEYSRTRHMVATEALTGSFVDYCPEEVARAETFGTRDDAATVVHTHPSFARQRRDGILDVYADNIYFGVGTFDSIVSPLTTEAGDYSYGSDFNGFNLGLAHSRAPLGGLVSPLPPGWVPDDPGAIEAFRLRNNALVQETISDVIPGLSSATAAAAADVQYLVHSDPGFRADPFAECRPLAHILVTDGSGDWEDCLGASPPTALACASYVSAGYGNAADALTALRTLGAGETDALPTYVVGFAVDDPGALTTLDALATAGGTCAIRDGDGACVEAAFRAEAQAELVFALGTIFNRFIGGELSYIKPLTSTLSLDSGIGMVRYRAGSEVSSTSPYWIGTLTREVFTCEVDPEESTEENIVRTLTAGETIDFADHFIAADPDDRTILTARLDIAADGASCERPDCPIGDLDCAEDGAIPDPASVGSTNFGDGTGGADRGGYDSDSDIEPVDPSASCVSDSYTRCAASCADGDNLCLCQCQEFNSCGTCGYTPSPPACNALSVTLCGLTCTVTDLLISGHIDCTCYCQDQLDCGTCANGAPVVVTPTVDATARIEVNSALEDLRNEANVRGNDDPLALPTAPVSFDALEVSDNSCLIPLDATTFVNNDLTTIISPDPVEAQGAIEFLRGATLEDLAADSLLTGTYLPALVSLHDREPQDMLGSFLHSEMALLTRPTQIARTSAGYLNFVAAAGARRYTLFIGGNDGMLHAFDALDGTEIWSIVPPSFLPQLPQMMFSHRISVDGSVVVRDLRCSQTEATEEWCTLLAVSYRGGGSGAMVLDVTNPDAPRFLYEVTGDQIGELGLGYPRPLLGNMLIDSEIRPVLVLTGGQPLAGPEVVIGSDVYGSHEGEVVVILDALTGEIYRQFDPVSDPDLFAQCGPVSGSPAGWSPDQFTRLFAGTQRGCMLRVDTSSTDPLEWTIESIYQTGSTGAISFPPALAGRADGRLVIVFGHGNTDQFEHVNQQANLVSINEDLDLANALLGDASPNFEIELEPGEFLTGAPIISDGVIYAATWVPNAEDACAGGSSRVWGIDYIGDPSISGTDTLRPFAVTSDSDRLIARMENPEPDDGSPEYEPVLRFLGEAQLGVNTVVFGVTIQSVPSCRTFTTVVTNQEGESGEVELAAGATTRQLIVDAVAASDHTGGTWGGDGGGEEEGEGDGDGEGDSGLTLVDLEQDLPQPAVTAVALDWGVVLEF